MNILISAVGTTDPISHNRDAALLHIARTYRPEQIVLVYSEEMLIKQDLIEKAIFSIEDYHPEVMIESTILKNDEVYLFDKMYEVMGQIVEKYSGTNHQLILNLSSGTPQIISALFALNRIKDYNTQAIQVATPNKSANRQYVPLSSEGEQKLFNENEDNQKDYEDRTIKDEAEKFNQSLIKRHLRNLIASYDYLAAEEIVTKKEYNNLLSKKKLSFLRATLNDFVKVFKTQAILKDIQDYPLTDVEKKALNYFLMIEVLKERGQVADVLIKSKSYVEFIIEEKIKRDYPDLIKYDGALPKLNEEYKDFEKILDFIDLEFKKAKGIENEEERIYSPQSTLNLLSYENILTFYQASPDLLKSLKVITSLNSERNKVAHGLSEIDGKLVNSKKLNQTIDNLRFVLQDTFDIEDYYFGYYKKINDELLDLLRS
ncbi:type III-A CRISPR-associated CARF protein Csm6 [uncultured Streptococcus sp.]|uniref:type III-A CRISPR-associated CARF protein Csm6 n=1 Tax=uncultured Streptococcus sp. TaxID=83427 RepID=UPI0028E8C028|nr:type III-A CRISPR-associated CARF protein Csm6 [uncultured Streptococcus sp.]